MTCPLPPNELTPEQKGQVFGILSVGCDRETAANFIGCSSADIGQAMRSDPAFAATVRRTEAAAEVNHMRNVQQAAKDEKNWRASVWWLERRSPDRFGSRSAGTVTTRNLKAFLEMLSGCLNEDVQNAEDRERILNRLQQIQRRVDQLADDLWDPPPEAEEGVSKIKISSESTDDPASEIDLFESDT
jgi:hypothetical protein